MSSSPLAESAQDLALLSQSPVVWLVVSSFRHDREIATMLEGVQNLPTQLFSRVLIVDSLGTGEIPKLIARRGWQNVVYYSYDHNLGSAGNLSERLRLAAAAADVQRGARLHNAAVTLEGGREELLEVRVRHAVTLNRQMILGIAQASTNRPQR